MHRNSLYHFSLLLSWRVGWGGGGFSFPEGWGGGRAVPIFPIRHLKGGGWVGGWVEGGLYLLAEYALLASPCHSCGVLLPLSEVSEQVGRAGGRPPHNTRRQPGKPIGGKGTAGEGIQGRVGHGAKPPDRGMRGLQTPLPVSPRPRRHVNRCCLYSRTSISGRGKTSAYKIILLNIAHSACETPLEVKKPSRL
jgi:hypothetical protein